MQGRAPQQGQGIGQPDFPWLLGLAGGDNRLVESITAFAGGGQASSTLMGTIKTQGYQAALAELRVVATGGDSAQLPQASAGKTLCVFNNTANSANIFANPNVSKITGALDTINALTNVTAYALAAGKSVLFFCPRDGFWAAILSA